MSTDKMTPIDEDGDIATEQKGIFYAYHKNGVDSHAVISAINNTYGAGINPEAVGDLKTALLFALEEIQNLITEKYDAATAAEYIAIKFGKAAIEKSKLYPNK